MHIRHTLNGHTTLTTYTPHKYYTHDTHTTHSLHTQHTHDTRTDTHAHTRPLWGLLGSVTSFGGGFL